MTITAPAKSLQSILSLCGIVAPILFSIVVVVLAALNPAYSHISQSISTLGGIGRPNAIVQDVNFLVLGSMMTLFAIGVGRGFEGGKAVAVGAISVALFGIGVFLAGVFPCEICSEYATTPADTTHEAAAAIAFFGFLPAPFLLWRGTVKNTRWRSLSQRSLVAGVVIAILTVLFLVEGQTEFQGLFQRLLVGAIFVYVVSVATRLFRESRIRPAEPK